MPAKKVNRVSRGWAVTYSTIDRAHGSTGRDRCCRQLFGLGCEADAGRCALEEQRLHAEPVANGDDPLLPVVPDDEGKVAVDVVEEVDPGAAVGLEEEAAIAHPGGCSVAAHTTSKIVSVPKANIAHDRDVPLDRDVRGVIFEGGYRVGLGQRCVIEGGPTVAHGRSVTDLSEHLEEFLDRRPLLPIDYHRQPTH